MTIMLTPDLAQIVERLVANGGYLSPDAVLRQALLELERHALPASGPLPHKPSLLDILQDLPPPGVFMSAAEADVFLRAERDAWDK